MKKMHEIKNNYLKDIFKKMAEEDKISFMDAIKKYKEGLNKGSHNIDKESEMVDKNKGSSLSGKKRHGSSNLNDENTVIY